MAASVPKRLTYAETVVRNMTTSEKYFGFLPPHGKRLKALGDASLKDYFTWTGDLNSYLQKKKRYYDHYVTSQNNGLIRVTENNRVIYFATVANATAFNINDLVWWDNTAKLAKPAAALTWDTNLATTQADYVNVHLGICLTTKVASDGQVTIKVDVGPNSLYDLAIASGTAYTIGDTFGPAKDTGNNIVSNKIVKAVATSSCLQAAADATTAATQVLVRQASVWVPGNINSDLG